MGGELREGLRFVLGHPYLRAITACTGISNFFGQFMFAILIVYAVRELGLGVGTIGLILTLGNFGFLAGALSANKISTRLGVGPTIIGSAFLFAAVAAPGPARAGRRRDPVLHRRVRARRLLRRRLQHHAGELPAGDLARRDSRVG